MILTPIGEINYPKSVFDIPEQLLVRHNQVEVNIFYSKSISMIFVVTKRFTYCQKNNTHVIYLFEQHQSRTERHCAC